MDLGEYLEEDSVGAVVGWGIWVLVFKPSRGDSGPRQLRGRVIYEEKINPKCPKRINRA